MGQSTLDSYNITSPAGNSIILVAGDVSVILPGTMVSSCLACFHVSTYSLNFKTEA